MESRKIHNYDDMLAAKKLPQLWVEYLQAVVDKLGPEVFGQMMVNKQDGRLFGNLRREGVEVRLESFYPAQIIPGKTIVVDLLGKEVNAAILDDLDDPKNSDKVASTVNAIGAFIADALNKQNSFQDLLTKIQASNPDYSREQFQNFILGQTVYYALLPVMSARVDVIKNEKYDLHAANEQKYKADLQKGGIRVPGKLEKLIATAQNEQALAGAEMKAKTNDINKMKTAFATIGNYDHGKAMQAVAGYALKSAAERPGVVAPKSAGPQQSVSENKKGATRLSVPSRAKSEKSKPKNTADSPFGGTIRHHNVESDPFAGVRLQSGSPSSSAVLAKAMNKADPKAAMQSVKDAVPKEELAPDKPAASPAQPAMSAMDKMREGFSKSISSSDSEEEKTPSPRK